MRFTSPAKINNRTKLQNPTFEIMGKLIRHEAPTEIRANIQLENEVVSTNFLATAGVLR